MAAYFIFRHKVLDADKLNNDYVPKAVETLGPYAPEIPVIDENIEVMDGTTEDTRTVVLKFKDRDEAKGWYHSAGIPCGRGASARCDGRLRRAL